jgi:hypothetical protein
MVRGVNQPRARERTHMPQIACAAANRMPPCARVQPHPCAALRPPVVVVIATAACWVDQCRRYGDSWGAVRSFAGPLVSIRPPVLAGCSG